MKEKNFVLEGRVQNLSKDLETQKHISLELEQRVNMLEEEIEVRTVIFFSLSRFFRHSSVSIWICDHISFCFQMTCYRNILLSVPFPLLFLRVRFVLL